MQDFLYKLGLMTQGNYAELLRAIQDLQKSICSMNESLSILSERIAETHNDLNEKIAAIADTVNSSRAEIKNLSANVMDGLARLDLKTDDMRVDSNNRIATLAEAVTANRVEIKNLPVSMTESLAQLNLKIDEQIALANDLRRNELSKLKPVLEQLKTLEEFLRLDIATRLMNVVEGEL